MKWRSSRWAVAALLAVWCRLGHAESAADWEWAVAPYLWAPSASLDVTVRNDPVIAADATFKDLLDKIDFAFALHFEGQCVHAGFFADGIWLDLGAHQPNTSRPPLPGGTQTAVDTTIGIYEVGGFYRVPGRARGLDILFGARMFDYRSRLDVTVPPPVDSTVARGTDRNLIDAFGGVRYLTPIGKRWDFLCRADAGAGGTDLAWNALASFGVRLGKTSRYNLRLGWRHMEFRISDDENPPSLETESDMTLTGPFFEFAMKF